MLTFVGIGPGDPELLTLKAVRILREVDAVALADRGVALKIVEKWIEGKPVLKLDLPMRGNRVDWGKAHESAVRELLAWLEKYPSIAFPVLGDPSVFATGSYLYRRIQGRHPCAVVPGIPAMCAAAAKLGVPLCEKGETLMIMDHFEDEDALPEENVVIMKSGKRMDALRRAAHGREAYVVRNLGMEEEWIGNLSDAPDMDQFYFTTTVVRARPEFE